jgi:redox-sensing transcriptional repressor
VNAFTNKIPDATVRRLSLYLRYLEDFGRSGIRNVASGVLAERGGTTAAQVRKDLSYLGSFGKRGLGYPVPELTRILQTVLGLDFTWRVALLGAGRIGTALFEYQPFRKRGFNITTVIDNDPCKVGTQLGDVTIRGEDDLECALREDGTDLVIVAVPAHVAQSLVDRVVEAGVKAVLNYAPVQLRLPDDVALRNVSMLVELQSLSHALARSRR